MAALRVAGLRRVFGPRAVLDGIDLELPTGSSTALLGPSGVGKSTLLRCIAGLDHLDSGVVEIDGIDVAGVPTHRRGVGFLFQDPALFPHLDVTNNVAFGLRMQGQSSDIRRTRVREVLDLVGLADMANRNVAGLSGGEAQRVALARALAPAPKLLLLDEPFGGLDRTRRDDLVVELRSLFDDLGLTILAVTHDPAEAAMLADRMAVLVNGRIGQDDAAGTVLTAPATTEIARLLGHPNVATVVVTNGVADTPWGQLAITAPNGPVGVVVPPDAVTIGERPLAPGVQGQVEGIVWRDQQRRVRVTVGGTVIEAATDAAVVRGQSVAIGVDAARTLVVGA
jgi:thiamine transport system ATP-binding protein